MLQPELSLSAAKEDMEAARLELTAYSHTLDELLNKIGEFLWSGRFLFEVPKFLRLCNG